VRHDFWGRGPQVDRIDTFCNEVFFTSAAVLSASILQNLVPFSTGEESEQKDFTQEPRREAQEMVSSRQDIGSIRYRDRCGLMGMSQCGGDIVLMSHAPR